MKRHLVIALMPLAALAASSCGTDNDVPAGSGFVEATEVVVSAETGGRLERLDAEEGETVKTGQAIALIDTTRLALQLAQARAQSEAAAIQLETASLQLKKAALDSTLAHTDFKRIQDLIASGSANRQQYDQAGNRYEQAVLAGKAAAAAVAAARAELARAEAASRLMERQLRDCRPVAPLRGKVVTTYVEPGELVTVGKPLVKIAGLDTVWVKIYLPPGDLTGIKLGKRAEVDPEDGREEALAGVVTWISPEAEFTPKNVQTKGARADLVYAVKVTIPNPNEELKIGMPVMVRIP